MSIEITQLPASEEILFESLQNVADKTEKLVRLKIIIENMLRQKLSAPNSIYSRLVLLAIEKYSLTFHQIRTLFFLQNLEKAIARNGEIRIDDPVFSYILKQTKKILEKIISTYELIPEDIFEIKEKLTDNVVLPDLAKRKHYIKTYIIKSLGFDKEKNFGKIFCRLENSETATVILHPPWDIFVKNSNIGHGQIVAFYNIKTLEKEGVLVADRNTLMILSPDTILDVTDIKSCINEITDYLITRICCTKKPGRAQIIGNAVNYIFDEMLTGEYEYSEESIRKSLDAFKFNLAIVGQTIGDIFEDVKYHLDNILKSGLIEKIKSSGSYSIEPSYISPEFGISGRIDVLCNDTKEIIELKTGKPKEFGAWINDQTQTALYSLMLLDLPQHENGKITVFYSKDRHEPYRNLHSTYPYFYLECIKRRNEMIAIDRRLATFSTEEMTRVNTELIARGRSPLHEIFRAEIIENFKKSPEGSIKEIAQNYSAELIAFSERERVFEKIEYSSLWLKSEYQKREEYKIIGPIEFLSEFTDGNKVAFSVENNESKFRDGDICIIYDSNMDISKQQITRGTIKKISREKIEISLRNKTGAEYLNLKRGAKWLLESDYMDISSRKDVWACFDFLSAEERKQKLILGLEKPDFHDLKEPEVDMKILNVPRQKEAIQKAVAAKDYFLIQGPPGTGKTTLLAHLIKELLKNPEERILVTAFTNRAVDEMIHKVLNEVDLNDGFIRLGGEFSTDFSEYSLQRQIETVPEEEIPEFLMSKRIYFSTIATASYHEIFQFLNFTTSIIDEASQLTESDTLSIILKTKRFILIGDEKQLPAVVAQCNGEKNILSIETNNKILNGIGIKRLDCSLFERLVRCNEINGWEGKVLLDRQYRMNDEILKFSNVNFYNSSLVSDDTNAGSKIDIDQDKSILNNIPIEFYNVKGYGEKKKNRNEAAVLVRVLEEYCSHIKENKLEISVGVITPFRAQVSLISQELSLRKIENVKVDTVERFQGGEKDIIFISFAAYHHSQISQIQSMVKYDNFYVDRKLNVALTRAKRKLIMFGNADLLSKNEIFRKLINYSKESGRFVNA